MSKPGICDRGARRSAPPCRSPRRTSAQLLVLQVRADLARVEDALGVKDLLDAMQVDAESPISVLRVDGGASVSSFLMQFQADMLRVPIDRPKLVETTAFGAAFLAGLACGVWERVDDIALLR